MVVSLHGGKMIDVKNPLQGASKRVLCVCSVAMLRSPSAAIVLANPPFNFNTRSAGLDPMALIPVTETLVEWADELICMQDNHRDRLEAMTSKKVFCLNIPDIYDYRQHELMKLISRRYREIVWKETVQ